MDLTILGMLKVDGTISKAEDVICELEDLEDLVGEEEDLDEVRVP